MNACSQTFSIHRKDLLGCQILNIIYWKRDKIKPNLKNKQEKKCSSENYTQFYTEIVHKISSGRNSTENPTSTTYYGKRKDSIISFHDKDEKNVCTKRIHFKVVDILQR